MPLKTESIEEPTLNLTPMIDIVFLLVIFFMVGARFSEMERQYDIQLPTVSDVQPLTSLPDDLTVNVRRNGEIWYSGQKQTLPELEAELQAARQNFPDQSVVIRGEGDGRYQHVMDVLAACRRAGIRAISLAHRSGQEEQQ
ncbi:MAG: biopolymer transporter ExbD [Planctomycetaceae bacterium]|nr:biopolymer transporter ExbD [Planctomycetaceae bacterium]